MIRIACGFTANADATGTLNEALLDRIQQRCTLPNMSAAPPVSYISSWDELYKAIVWSVQRGSGAEYIITNESVLAEMDSLTDWSWAVGGTGLQAASAVCAAGYGAVVNFPVWSKDFDFLVSQSGLEMELKEHGRPAVHYILEYNREDVSNRIILRGLKEFGKRLIAPGFAERLRNKPDKCRWLLISGYNAADAAEDMVELLAETKQFLQTLGECRLPVHLELAAIFSRDDQYRIIHELGPLVQSIGLNEDELGELFPTERPLLELNDDRLIGMLLEAHNLFKAPNLIVHTHQFAACVTSGSRSGWKEALSNGVRFAASKAAEGRFCTLSEIETWESALQPHPRGARLAQAAEKTDSVIIVPALKARAVCTVGLGDTFTGGLLLTAPISAAPGENEGA